MITKEFLGRSIAEYREKQGLSQIELASIADVSVHTLRSWEQGRAEMSTISLVRIASALKLDGFDILQRARELSLEPVE